VKRRQASWFTAREMRHTDLQEAVSTLRGLESSFLLHVMRSGSNFPLQPIPTPDQALHQLAHEVIHLLAPHRSPPAVMLEEGLAVHFSVYAPTFISPTYRRDALEYLITTPEARNYLDALCVYNELVAIEPNAIVVLRQKEPKFHAMDPSFIMSMIPRVREELAARLCERRQMR
jgi:hypothetical protein